MITLLNGERITKPNLLEKMQSDSYYYGHLGQYALSSSALKKLIEGPKAYQASLRKSESSQALRDGQLIHLSILEPHKLKDLVITEGTKARKEYKEAVAEHGEHKVYTQSEMESAYWIADAVKSNPTSSFLLENCDYEVPNAAMIEGLPFRAKADAITKDGSTIIDIKTTASIGENGDDFYWSARKFKYALQAVLYMEIFGAVDFIFLVVDKGTREIGIFDCSDEFLEIGKFHIAKGIENYKKFFMSPDSETLIKNNVIRRTL